MAQLDADSFVIKKMYRLGRYTTSQRNALSPRTGDIIWNTTDKQVQVYNGTDWFEF